MKIFKLFKRGLDPPPEENRTEELQREQPHATSQDLIVKNDVEILREKRRGLRASVPLFYYYKERVNELNGAKIPCEIVARDMRACKRTVKNWAKALSDVGVLKYKYSGAVCLNPIYSFNGTRSNYEKALSEYEKFKGDL